MSKINQYQLRYWREFYGLKVRTNYVDLYQNSSESWDRRINIFLAITSSGSIGGWVIWNELRLVWSVIIACSQVINAVKTFLPYKRRIRILNGLYYDLRALALEVEKNWFDVYKGKLSERQIHDIQITIKAKKSDLLKKHLGSNALPEKKRLMKKAKEQTMIYFKGFYLGG